jgi:transcriptional regulator with XRE-family HTH domain
MDRLAELRDKRALTLRELAEMSGVAADTINQIELGHRKPRPSTLRKLARALEVDVEELVSPKVASPSSPTPEPTSEGELRMWLAEHGAQRTLITDRDVVENFKRMGSGSGRQAIPDRFEQEWSETAQEEAKLLDALTKESTRGGALLPKLEQGPNAVERAFARHKEFERLRREIRGRYGRYYRALEAFSRFLYFSGRADDYMIVNKRLQTVEAERAATRALQEEAFEDARGA